MKKRLLSLLCVVLMIFALVACGEDDFEVDTRGVFYEEDGLYQNSLITLVITNENLTVPVEKLTFTLYNNAEYKEKFLNSWKTLQIYRDGKWENPFGIEDVFRVHKELLASPTDPVRVRSSEIVFLPENPLPPGFYRFIWEFEIFIPEENESVYVYPTAYFTVTAPEA